MLKRAFIGWGLLACAVLMVAHVGGLQAPRWEELGESMNSNSPSGSTSPSSGYYPSSGGYYSTPSRGSGGAFSWGGGK